MTDSDFREMLDPDSLYNEYAPQPRSKHVRWNQINMYYM